MKDIALLGAGGLGREVLVLLHQINEALPTWNIIGFYDDDPTLHGEQVSGFQCLGPINQLLSSTQSVNLAVCFGNPHVKRAIVSQLASNPLIKFPSLVHPSVLIKPYQDVTIGEGVIINQGSVLTTHVRVGAHAFVNLNCTIGHDTLVESFASIMPGVNLSGSCRVGLGAYLGTGATVLPGLSIGNNSIVGAGAVVTTSVPPNCTAVGVPAKVIKQHEL